ncbi:hypothetical protein NCLIV_034240 [Neospora caninum Liverpool]|uniref:Solute carrier family 25 member 42 n=1 Tax=Neospora caninum (strain Liverpool) TaxID=572307 RepID=F0VIS6_NEOCL|nr:hypothetical protein NCLIV_034240 [Neospora caninum Liverpool]CBZ53637.1 hypothetical protein NCLIV_034240 [Neospora caninum Liverpool]CEL67628.1 TPA: Solute carrier family 25 member 42 [Neospora caninum Liverpool]|eukprot:XP_003883669.1 hypothetical protein NCLIV_034240 [Neospora caninum Liverpool]
MLAPWPFRRGDCPSSSPSREWGHVASATDAAAEPAAPLFSARASSLLQPSPSSSSDLPPASSLHPKPPSSSSVSSSPFSLLPDSRAPASCAAASSSLQGEAVAGARERLVLSAEPSTGATGNSPRNGQTECLLGVKTETLADTAHAVMVNDSWTAATAPLCAACQVLRGALAGSCAKTVVYPLDRLKMHLQVKAAATGQAFQLSGAYSVMKGMVSPEQGGLRALWRGNGTAFIRAFPYSGFSFYSFERYNAYLRSRAPSCPKLCHLGAGSAAGMTATLITYPLDVLNTRMAVTEHRLSYAQVSLWQFEGFRSLFRGISATALGIVPYAGISFCTFESLKEECRAQGISVTPMVNALCGGVAGVAGQTATYPLDTVRKFMQSSSFLYRFQETGHTGSAAPPSLVEAFKFLYRRAGWRGLYNGVSLNWIKGFLAAGLAFSLNESGKQYLTPRFCQHPERAVYTREGEPQRRT